ncbi:hypothetical protein BKA80DRAFT_275143 [Phyllosticta citrichinensis]
MQAHSLAEEDREGTPIMPLSTVQKEQGGTFRNAVEERMRSINQLRHATLCALSSKETRKEGQRMGERRRERRRHLQLAVIKHARLVEQEKKRAPWVGWVYRAFGAAQSSHRHPATRLSRPTQNRWNSSRRHSWSGGVSWLYCLVLSQLVGYLRCWRR